MLLEIWLILVILAFAMMILGFLSRISSNEILLFGWISVGLFFILGITGFSIQKNYCYAPFDNATFACHDEEVGDEATANLFYSLGILDLLIFIVLTIWRPIEQVREAAAPIHYE